MTVTQLDSVGVYLFDLGGAGRLILGAEGIQITGAGDWSKVRAGGNGPITVDFSPMFVNRRLLFEGDIRELIRYVSVAKGAPSYSTRIVTAAHRDFNPRAYVASPALSKAGMVEIGSNGFVCGGDAKSGWVNMPARPIRLRDGGRRFFVRLSSVTFWVASCGQDWLSFSIGGATASADETSPGTFMLPQPEAAVVRTVDSSAEKEEHGTAILLIGQHRFHAVLPTLDGALTFDEEYAPATIDAPADASADTGTPVTVNDAPRGGAQSAPTSESAVAPARSQRVEIDVRTDPDTGLTWVRKDAGSGAGKAQAATSCRDLGAAGFRDWRPPTIDEFKRMVRDPSLSNSAWTSIGRADLCVR